MSEYDIVIIGSGPAGLEAAITATIRKKNILLLGQKKCSTKLFKAHAINNYLGFPGIEGSDLEERFEEHIKALGIEITPKTASAVYDMGDYLAVQSCSDMFQCQAVILATGDITQNLFPGEEALLGKGVSYCATCDAALYRDKTAIVIAYSKNEEPEAEFLAEYAKNVIYIPMYDNPEVSKDNIEIVNKKPAEILGDDSFTALKTDDGDIPADGVFILRESIAPDTLIPGIEMDSHHVVVKKDMSTNIPGVFACGDITGLPYQFIKAAGEGDVAALSACAYIDAKNKA